MFAPATTGRDIIEAMSLQQKNNQDPIKLSLMNGMPASILHSTLATSSVGIFAVFFAAATYVFTRRMRFLNGNANANRDMEAGTAPAIDAEAARALPTETFSKNEFEGSEIMCSVCLENFEEGATLRRLPCKHRFHQKVRRRSHCSACLKACIRSVYKL